MIPTKHIFNVKRDAPILNLIGTSQPYMEKVAIRELYPQWRGENIQQLKEHKDNPYRLRIGTTAVDDALKQDHAYFIQSYLSYNPTTKDIEKRDIIPYRNVDKIYIGKQTAEEKAFNKYAAFINGTIIVKDLITIDNRQSLLDTISKLQTDVQKLTKEVAVLRLQLQKETIYKQ